MRAKRGSFRGTASAVSSIPAISSNTMPPMVVDAEPPRAFAADPDAGSDDGDARAPIRHGSGSVEQPPRGQQRDERAERARRARREPGAEAERDEVHRIAQRLASRVRIGAASIRSADSRASAA